MIHLEELFNDLIPKLPTDEDAQLTLSAANCPCPPVEVTTANLKVIGYSLRHNYGDSARYDGVHFFADQATYQRFGLLLLASLFHPIEEIVLNLTHPESTVLKLRISGRPPAPPDERISGLVNLPVAYGYTPNPINALHPLYREEWRIEGNYSRYASRNEYHLPYLSLTNDTGGCGNPQEFDRRTVVEGFGSLEATATLGALLLDFVLPQSTRYEINLESPSGYWSVAIGSAEARFWLGYEITL